MVCGGFSYPQLHIKICMKIKSRVKGYQTHLTFALMRKSWTFPMLQIINQLKFTISFYFTRSSYRFHTTLFFFPLILLLSVCTCNFPHSHTHFPAFFVYEGIEGFQNCISSVKFKNEL